MAGRSNVRVKGRGDGARRFALRRPALALEALMMLIAASIAIRLLPFRTIGRLAARGGGGGPSPDRDRIAAMERLLMAWSKRVPWRALCYQRGLAMQMMLRRRGLGSVLWLGAGYEDADSLASHVWVTLDGEIVIGGDTADRHAPLMRFPKR